MSGAHEGCSQGKRVRDREGSKHSTAATLERVDSQAAVLPQAFKDRVHARQLAGVVQESGVEDESSRFGTLTFNMTHASERGAAARKSKRLTRIAGVEKFVGSRFTPTCNTSAMRHGPPARKPGPRRSLFPSAGGPRSQRNVCSRRHPPAIGDQTGLASLFCHFFAHRGLERFASFGIAWQVFIPYR